MTKVYDRQHSRLGFISGQSDEPLFLPSLCEYENALGCEPGLVFLKRPAEPGVSSLANTIKNKKAAKDLTSTRLPTAYSRSNEPPFPVGRGRGPGLLGNWVW